MDHVTEGAHSGHTVTTWTMGDGLVANCAFCVAVYCCVLLCTAVCRCVLLCVAVY